MTPNDRRSAPAPQFGFLLRRFRSRSGLSQEALADRAAISVAAVGALERGTRRAPYAQTIWRLAEALELSPDERDRLQEAADGARERRRTAEASASDRFGRGLPVVLTTFVERPEIERLARLVDRHRLVTIAGPGGIGKTRSAIEVAKRYRPDGERVLFCDLSEIASDDAVFGHLAARLDLPLHTLTDAQEDVASILARGPALLVLDTCEHVLAGASRLVQSLSATCPELRVLATSREPLGLASESVFRLPALEEPAREIATLEEARSYPALDLFLTRAEAVAPQLALTAEHVPLVAQICRRLDGIPLAIELATASLPVLGLAQLAARLDDALRSSPVSDRPLRQRTMDATIRWSYDFLGDDEREVLRSVSIFVGGFTLDAAEQVCANERIADTSIEGRLAHLVRTSLVDVRDVDGTPRYALLDTIRAFASRLLDACGETADVARRHAAWLARFADRVAEQRPTVRTSEYFAECENARSAVHRYAAGNEADALLAARIVTGFRLLLKKVVAQDARVAIARRLLERIEERQEPSVALRLIWLLLIEDAVGTCDDIRRLFERSLALCERIGTGEAFVATYHLFAVAYCHRGALAAADTALDRASEICGLHPIDDAVYTRLLVNRAYIRSIGGRIDDARSDLRVSIRLARDRSLEEERLAGLLTLAEVQCAAERYDLAAAYSREVLQSDDVRFDQRFVALCNLSGYLILSGDVCGAQRRAREALASGAFAPEIPIVMQHFATAAAMLDHPVLAARLLGYVDEWYRRGHRDRLVLERRGYELLIEALERQLSRDEIEFNTTAGASLDAARLTQELLAVTAC